MRNLFKFWDTFEEGSKEADIFANENEPYITEEDIAKSLAACYIFGKKEKKALDDLLKALCESVTDLEKQIVLQAYLLDQIKSRLTERMNKLDEEIEGLRKWQMDQISEKNELLRRIRTHENEEEAT